MRAHARPAQAQPAARLTASAGTGVRGPGGSSSCGARAQVATSPALSLQTPGHRLELPGPHGLIADRSNGDDRRPHAGRRSSHEPIEACLSVVVARGAGPRSEARPCPTRRLRPTASARPRGRSSRASGCWCRSSPCRCRRCRRCRLSWVAVVVATRSGRGLRSSRWKLVCDMSTPSHSISVSLLTVPLTVDPSASWIVSLVPSNDATVPALSAIEGAAGASPRPNCLWRILWWTRAWW